MNQKEWREQHPEYMKTWLEQHPDYMKNWKEQNLKKNPDYNRNYYRENMDKIREQRRKYYQKKVGHIVMNRELKRKLFALKHCDESIEKHQKKIKKLEDLLLVPSNKPIFDRLAGEEIKKMEAPKAEKQRIKKELLMKITEEELQTLYNFVVNKVEVEGLEDILKKF